jgi:hypothetical protein
MNYDMPPQKPLSAINLQEVKAVAGSINGAGDAFGGLPSVRCFHLVPKANMEPIEFQNAQTKFCSAFAAANEAHVQAEIAKLVMQSQSTGRTFNK